MTIHPTWLGFRLKGQRKVFQMDIEAAYQRAAQAEADKLRAERKALKIANKKQGRRRG